MTEPRYFALPVDAALPELCRCLAEQGGAVLEAPPGAGKSTRVPLVLLDAPWRGDGRILVLEPRRVAARAVAGFMAHQLGEPVGQTVGYRTRLDTRVSAATRIEVVTEGVLTRMLSADPALDGYAAVLFDEFHERSLQADLGLALVQEVRQALREDLRLLVMSATLEVGPLAEGLSLPTVRSEGRMFPVTVSYAPPGRDQDPWDHCARQVEALAGAGTVLVFLPGVGEIERLRERLSVAMPVQVLHGRLAGDAQAAVLEAPSGPRVVLATNVAETSVTIEGVTVVVDAGLERRPSYDPRRQRSRLVTRRISQANADQRAGRAGRLGPGRCVRLWAREEVLARHIEPEIHQTGLESLVLDLARWGCRDPHQLFWLDPPPPGPWRAAVQRLRALGALDRQDAITDLGRRLNDLPLTPELAALVVRGRDAGLAASAARVAVLLSERMPGLDRQVDLAERLRRLNARPSDWPLLGRALSRLNGDRKDHAAPGGAQPGEALGTLLADTFPDRIARRRDGEEDRYLLADGSGARLPPNSPLAGREWLVVLDTDGRPRDAVIRLAWALGPSEVSTLLARHAQWRDQVVWDDKQQRVRAERRYAVGAITVESQPLASPSPAQIEQGLLDGVRQQGLRVLPWTDATRQWRARVAWLHRLEPAHWPAMDDGTLLADLETWLLPFLPGRRALRDLKSLPLLDALKLRLGPGQAGELTRRLPERVTVASGRAVAINYEAEGGPRLAVKLQECFGMENLPALAEGRLPLTAELLTPAGRPAAITADLAGFWRSGYGEVRKELRGRYPKHPWPEDPLMAPATGRTKARSDR
ncbi:MAG TPA: ATP-dependent helicase HrpB [Alcanivorax sp.]|nr:ATP-dependent helicase HrpB [Alcanivorax sp.]